MASRPGRRRAGGGPGAGAARRGPGGVDAERSVERGFPRAFETRSWQRAGRDGGGVPAGGNALVRPASSADRRRRGRGAGSTHGRSPRWRTRQGSGTGRAPPAVTPSPKTPPTAASPRRRARSWRMIVSFDAGALSAVGVYPGGQSENPASPWYTNLVPLWWDGQYLPLPVPGTAGWLDPVEPQWLTRASFSTRPRRVARARRAGAARLGGGLRGARGRGRGDGVVPGPGSCRLSLASPRASRRCAGAGWLY